jgi:type IV pilus assembly protein PilX
MALVSAILLLLVLTILSVGMFRSFGLQERIAGNTREKQRATHAAEAAQNYAEWWLSTSGGVNATNGTACSAALTAATICTNVITNVITPSSSTSSWQIAPSYTPSNMNVGAAGSGTAGTADYYIQAPEYYISFLASDYNPKGGSLVNAYQVDGMSYAGNNTTVSVVESTYLVSVTYSARTDGQKYVGLGGN